MTRRHVIPALRRALDAGPEPYAHLDIRLATKLGGAFYLIGVAYVVIVLPLAPPEHGTAGWIGVVACLAAAVGAGVAMLRRKEPMTPETLLTLTLAGIVVAGLYRWAAGAGGPFHQLLLLACLYGCAVHPARRAFMVLALASAAAASPAIYGGAGDDFVPLLAGHLALTWSVGVLIIVWTTRVRALRREVSEAREQADHLARIDPLTGLGNRRALNEALAMAVAYARRSDLPLSVLVADLDDFKSVNDEYGHHAGDDLLTAAARAVTGSVRLPDPCFRWGGDEFVALLPGADEATAREVADRIAAAVATTCTRPDGQPLRMTVGATELADGESGDDLLARADGVLLARKARRTTSLR